MKPFLLVSNDFVTTGGMDRANHALAMYLARKGHPVHLVAVFRRYMHCTPCDFLRRLRVEFAAGQLLRTRMPLVEIALQAGFTHQSHFCRVFKTITGMTPSAYRELFARAP